MLRKAKGENEKLENKRSHPEKSLVLQLTEEYLQNMKCQVSAINDAITRLEMKNVEIRADTEALKLGGSEFERPSQEVLKRGKKCMKKIADVEKQINILRSQFEDEKLRAMHLEQEVLQAEKEAKEMEVKWREIKEKESMFALVAEEFREVDIRKASSRADLSKLRQKVETGCQLAEDDCRRLEDELCRLRMSRLAEDSLPAENSKFLHNYNEATSLENLQSSLDLHDMHAESSVCRSVALHSSSPLFSLLRNTL